MGKCEELKGEGHNRPFKTHNCRDVWKGSVWLCPDLCALVLIQSYPNNSYPND